ncbi:MAG: RusA family crossover junction endodeoxyribonuclease [Phycisphaerae bacterium]
MEAVLEVGMSGGGPTTITLPYPPSVNHYWRMWRGRMVVSREGRRYRKRVAATLAALGVRPLDGPVEVEIELYPPDRRRRDVDNAQKSLLDALEKGGAYHDDSQIVRLLTEKRGPVKGGRTIVRISKAT